MIIQFNQYVEDDFDTTNKISNAKTLKYDLVAIQVVSTWLILRVAVEPARERAPGGKGLLIDGEA